MQVEQITGRKTMAVAAVAFCLAACQEGQVQNKQSAPRETVNTTCDGKIADLQSLGNGVFKVTGIEGGGTCTEFYTDPAKPAEKTLNKGTTIEQVCVQDGNVKDDGRGLIQAEEGAMYGFAAVTQGGIDDVLKGDAGWCGSPAVKQK